MLTRLRLENFKCWQNTGDIPLKPITGFFGTNSSGKSSLIQALLLLKQTAESRDRGPVFQFGDGNTLVDLGDFLSVIYKHETRRTLGMSLDWESKNRLMFMGGVDHGLTHGAVYNSNRLGFEVAVRKERNSTFRPPFVEKMAYRIGDVVIGMSRSAGRDYTVFTEATEFQFTRRANENGPIMSPIKCYGFADEVREIFRYGDFVSDLEREFEQNLRRVYYLGPLRALPQRIYSWSGNQPADMGVSGEFAVSAILASRERGEESGQDKDQRKVGATLEQNIAQCLKDIGLVHEIRVVPLVEGGRLFEVKVRKSPNSTETLLADTGFGVSQILPALALCFYVPEDSTIILEQPEIHLHPFAQAGLADVLIDAYKKRNVQIIIESHSEHLLSRLQRRIAEKEITNEDVSLFFCSEGQDGSELTTLDIDQYGNIKNWPDNFFGDQFGEVAAMSKAALKRQMESE